MPPTMGSGDSAPAKAWLAQQAYGYYSIGKYDKALTCLNELGTQRSEKEDPRVFFNTILTEHAKGGFKEPVALRERITAIRNSLKERSVKSAARAKDSLRLEEDVDQNDETDTDTSVLLYNLAALYFHEKQYGASRQILHTLFARIEVLDEALGVQVCFLLLDVLLHSSRGNTLSEKDQVKVAQHTAALLSYLERPHTFGPSPASLIEGEGGSGKEEWEGGNAETSGSGKDGDKGGRGKGGERNMELIEFNFRLHLYKAKVRLLQGQLKVSKKEIKSALEIFQRELRPSSEVFGGAVGGGKGADSDDEEGGGAMPVTSGTSGGAAATPAASNNDPSLPPAGYANLAALYLKANLEYLRHNYKKALKLLASCHRGVGPSVQPRGPAYFNNMGCLHHSMGLYHVALQYFQKGLQCFEPGSLSSRTLEGDGRVLPHSLCEVVYNTGVQLLLVGRFEQAFRCFETSSLLYYNRPRLWLRMAECCIQHYRAKQDDKARSTKDCLIRRVAGKGRFRRIVLPPSNDPRERIEAMKAAERSAEEGRANGSGGAAGGPNLRGECSLPYACKCLQNALFLLDNASQGGDRSRLHVSSLLGARAGLGKDGVGGAAGATLNAEGEGEGAENGTTAEVATQQDDALIEQVALLNLSYVYLCLHEPVLALHYAEVLLSRVGVSEARTCTAHTYAAEARCMLNGASEAYRHLMPNQEKLSEDAAAAAVATQRQSRAKEDRSLHHTLPEGHFTARARSALHVNMANVALLQGNFSHAEQYAREALAACPNSPDALRMLLFILLRKGSTTQALDVLKRRPT